MAHAIQFLINIIQIIINYWFSSKINPETFLDTQVDLLFVESLNTNYIILSCYIQAYINLIQRCVRHLVGRPWLPK